MVKTDFPSRIFPEIMISCALTLLVAVFYWPVFDYGFINYDDPLYVTQNAHVQRGVTMEGLAWAFRDFGSSNWHPLTWLSHMIDWQLFGDNAGAHHGMNVLLHAGNAILLFAILRLLTGTLWQSALVAVLFAVHPVNVESVAWIAERKNLLSTFFGFLTLLCYAFYIRKPEWKKYLPIFVTFGLGLMAKPMLVTLPFLLLLLDFWPGRRHLRKLSDGHLPHKFEETMPNQIRQVSFCELLMEKIPLILLSVASIAVTILAAEKGGSLKSLDHFSVPVRLGNSLNAYASYLGKFVWPRDLAVFYPHPGTFDALQTAASLIVIFSISVIVMMRSRRHPYLTVGGLWFLGTLVPVIGLVQVGLQSMADRYLYFPMIGLLIMLVWSAADLGRKNAAMKYCMICLAIVLIPGASFGTRQQLEHWKSSRLLFEHALQVSGPNPVVYSNLAHALFEEGDWNGSEENYRKAIRSNPKYVNAHANLGAVLVRQGRIEEAVEECRKALQLDPRHADAHYFLGLAMEKQAKYSDADEHYEAAQQAQPDHLKAVRQRGVLAMRSGNYGRAVAFFQAALRIDPGDAGLKDAVSQALERRDSHRKVLDRKRN
ncbi:MAG: tetratricopeptide repeat protein [Syntrophales bacterium]|nr:tetratricopeptide repeat protein [Syntrophales bacterium]